MTNYFDLGSIHILRRVWSELVSIVGCAFYLATELVAIHVFSLTSIYYMLEMRILSFYVGDMLGALMSSSVMR